MALELGQGLRANKSSVDFVTSVSSWTDGDFVRRSLDLKFPVHTMRLGFISATLNSRCLRMTASQVMRWPELALSYIRFLREERPDRVVHTNWHHLLLLWPFLLNPARDVFWLHDVVPESAQYRIIFRWLSRRLGYFIPVSYAVANSLLKIGVPRDKIHVVHNGLGDPAAMPNSRIESPGRIRIGIVGRVAEWKGHQDLLEAFALIAANHPTSELHIFGSGHQDYESTLRQRSEALGVASRVMWRGFIDNRTDIYSQFDICVVPSRCSDSLPTVAIEAAFFRLPIIASRRGGLPEIVEHGITGFLVDAENPQLLAARLDDLLKDAALRDRMGRAARERAEKNFSRERFVMEFAHLLDELRA